MSKTITGKVLSKEINVTIQGLKNSYPGYRLVYSTPDGKVDKLEKHIKGLDFSPAYKAALEGLNTGDEFTLEMEKNGQYWEPKSITKGMALPSQEAATAPTKQWKSDKSANTYETPEERATRREIDVKRQRLIVRQSSIDQARQIAGTDAKLPAIFKLAEQIEDYVYRGISFPNDGVVSAEPAEVS